MLQRALISMILMANGTFTALTYHDKSSTLQDFGISPSVPSHRRNLDSGRNSGNSRNPDGVHIDEDCSQYATKSNSDRSTVYIADIRNTTRMPNIKKGNLFSRNGYSSGGRGLGGARGGTAGEPTNVVELFSRSAPMLVGDIRDAEALERAQRQENDQLQYLGEYMVSGTANYD